MFKKISLVFLIASVCVISSCNSKKVKPTGFLHTYDTLKQTDPDSERLFYEKKCVLWSRYKKVIVDPVKIYFSEEFKKRKLDSKDIKKIASYFHQAMVNEIKKNYEIVTEPAPDTIRIRAAIVDVKPVNILANLISKTLIYVPVDLGEAAIEGELLASLTGERLAAITDHKTGSMFSILGTYTTWGAVETALDEWAEQLASVLDKTLKQQARNIKALHVEANSSKDAVIRFELSRQPKAPKSFISGSPPTLSLDFDATRNALPQKSINTEIGPIKNISVIENMCKTRIVVKLAEKTQYTTYVENKNFMIKIKPAEGEVSGSRLWSEYHSE